MTISLRAAKPVSKSDTVAVLAFHINDGAEVQLQVEGGIAILDQEQREALAAYLVKENN